MQRSGVWDVTKFFKAAKKYGGNRVFALCMCLLMVASMLIPPASAYAIERESEKANAVIADVPHKSTPPDTKTEMKQDYPGPTPTPKSELTPTVAGQPRAVGEAMPAVTDKKPIKTGEIAEKRTATTKSIRNVDGTITEERHFQPIYYQKDGVWQDIESTLVEDKNAADSGNAFGRAFGQAQSWFSSTTNFQVKANSWQARFSPSGSPLGLLRVKQGNDQISFKPVNAKDIAPVITTDEKGVQTVHYYDLWPGVNVEYTVQNAQVKEYITLKDKDAATQVSFEVSGATLEQQKSGGFAIKGAFGDKYTVAPINLMLNKYGPVTDVSHFRQAYKDGVLTTSIDKAYLQKLPADAFPATIDPGIDTTSGLSGGDYKAFKNDNTVCAYNTTPQCKIYVGVLADGSGYVDWRSAYYAPYSSFQDPHKVLKVAKIYFNMQTGPGYHGTTSNQEIYAYKAYCTNGYNCEDSAYWGGQGTVGSTGEIDVTPLYDNRIKSGDFGMWLFLEGNTSVESFKEFDPAYTVMKFTYADKPVAPPIVTPSNYGQVFTDPQVSFRIQPVANPNTSTPLTYKIRISSGPGGTGTIMESGEISATQWTIPDGMLQDGSTYYIQTQSCDNSAAGCGDWSVSIDFKIDMRTGKDKTQTYDSLGPVDVDLATGNVATSASSHSTTALGGSLGVGLDYNSPVRSRNGLKAEYWNGSNTSGPATMTRIDQNIDFDWNSGSPSTGQINADSFSAKWTGWFVAPRAGAYYFGGNNDDNMAVTVNSVAAYSSTGCSSVCYGSSTVTLTAGQVVPIVVTYYENTGNAYAKLWAKGPVDEGAVPSTWLRTDVRQVNQHKGLVGRYYYDDGTHNLDATAPQPTLFMQRTDPLLNFGWETGSPMANGPTDNFMVRWKGYFVPPTSDTYTFGAASDDGIRIKLGTTSATVLDRWQDQGASNNWNATGTYLTAGTPVPIIVDYYEHTGGATMAMKVKYTGNPDGQVVPTDWLTADSQLLPDGWNLGIDPDGDLSYDRAKINQNSVVLTDSTGDSHEYTAQNGGYKPPVNEDGQLVRNNDGTFTLQDADGRTYIFAASGELTSVTTPVDDRKPAALKYEYTATAGYPRVQYIRDGVDPTGRWARAWYAGESGCGTIPTGFVTTPAGMLCALETNDGRKTYFYYTNISSSTIPILSRIAKPGSEYTDYFYDGYGRITGVRDSLANDAVAAGKRTNDDNVKTTVAYDTLGRVSSVTQPAPTSGATRMQHTVEYSVDAPAGTWLNDEPIADTVVGAPVSVSWNGTAIDTFARGADGSLQHKWFNGTTWSAWTSRGGCITGNPAVTSWGANRLDIFAVGCGTNAPLWHIFYDGQWKAWENMGGVPKSSPSAVAWSGGRIDVMARNASDGVSHLYWDGQWKGWEDMGGCITGAPTISASTAWRLDIFAQHCTATGNNLNHKAYDITTGWQAWETLGYHITGSPSATGVTAGRIDVVAPDGSSSGTGVGHVAYNAAGGWGTLQTLTGVCTAEAPSLFKMTSDRANMLTKGCESSGNNMHRRAMTLPTGSSRQHVVGATEPNGFSRRIEYDSLLRTTKDTDIANLSTVNVWDSIKDLLHSTTDATGLMSTTIYDDDDRPVSSYGPAPSSYFGSDRKPLTTYVNTVPRTDTAYDEGIVGPQVAWFNTKNVNNGTTTTPAFFGAPKLHTTGFTTANPGTMQADFRTIAPPITVDSGNDSWGYSATGKLRFPQTGVYNFNIWHDDAMRVWVNDELLIDDWTYVSDTQKHSVNQGFAAEAGKVYRFRVDFANRGNNFLQDLWLKGPGITDTSGSGWGTQNWSSYLTPGYNLTTSSKTYDATLGNSVNTTNYGSNPELGLAQSMALDPTGLNLSSSTTYETQGATGTFLRQLTKTLPGGNVTNYSYYTATETKDNPCTTGATEAYKQGGMMKLRTEPDPDGAGSQTPRVTETIYDDSGKIVATRINTDSWTCTTYDSRERVATTTIPAYNGAGARTVENDYAVGGDPLAITSWDGQGWIVTWMDLLGRTTKYRDVHDDETTSTYDSQGHLTQRVSPLGTETFTYDSYDKLVDQKLDNVTYAHITYNSYAQIDNVTYPAAGQQKVTMARDALGRLNSLTYTLGDGTTTVNDTTTRTQSNQVTQDVVTSGSNSLWYGYSYDGAGRLTGATAGPHTYSYGYGTESSTCNSVAGNNTNAGKNSNRTTQTIDGVTTTFCYDQADRLKSSSDALYNGGDYDSHGNMTSVGSGTTPLRLCYDSSDRNTCMTQRDSSGNGIAMYYNRDVQGRIVARFKNTLTNWNAAAAGDYYYGFTGSGDTPDFVRDQNWNVLEKNLELPGGVIVTIKPQETVTANKAIYSLPNNHGDTLLTTNASGTNTSNGNGPLSTFTYDPFGVVISGSTLPNNADQASYGWLGQHQKLTESQFALVPVQMGARVYIPGMGRFLQVDPQEGGTPNAYVYPPDPVNDFDLTGEFGLKSFANIASYASVIPGPIGMASAAVSAAAYAAAGDKKSATLMVVGIAAASVGAGAAIKAAQITAKVAPKAGAAAKVAKIAGSTSIKGISAVKGQKTLKISGYTRHGLNQAISNDNHGVSVRAIYDAVHKPLKIDFQKGGKVKYTGKNAVVVLNKGRQVITTWATSKKGWRY